MEGTVRGIIAGTTREFHPDVCKWAMGLFSGSIATGLWRWHWQYPLPFTVEVWSYTSAPLPVLTVCSIMVRVPFTL